MFFKIEVYSITNLNNFCEKNIMKKFEIEYPL